MHLIGAVAVNTPGYTPGTNYEKARCECGREIWVGPVSANLIREGKAIAACMECCINAGAVDAVTLNPKADSKFDRQVYDRRN